MKEYDIKITEVLEKTVQVQADSREEAEAIASENWNNSLYEMDSAEDYADVSFHAGVVKFFNDLTRFSILRNASLLTGVISLITSFASFEISSSVGS